MTNRQKDICYKIKNFYGRNAQLIKTIEELSEVTVAIARYMNFPEHFNKNLEPLINEIADVEIMLEQLKQILTEDATQHAEAFKYNIDAHDEVEKRKDWVLTNMKKRVKACKSK